MPRTAPPASSEQSAFTLTGVPEQPPGAIR